MSDSDEEDNFQGEVNKELAKNEAILASTPNKEADKLLDELNEHLNKEHGICPVGRKILSTERTQPMRNTAKLTLHTRRQTWGEIEMAQQVLVAHLVRQGYEKLLEEFLARFEEESQELRFLQAELLKDEIYAIILIKEGLLDSQGVDSFHPDDLVLEALNEVTAQKRKLYGVLRLYDQARIQGGKLPRAPGQLSKDDFPALGAGARAPASSGGAGAAIPLSKKDFPALGKQAKSAASSGGARAGAGGGK